MKPIIYLQSCFWDNLSSNNSRESIRTMLEFSEALCESQVITDATEDMILHDDFLKIIIKQKSYQRCDTHYIDKRIYSLNTPTNSKDLFATFLTGKTFVECQNIENDFGVLILNAKAATEKLYIVKGDGFSLDKKKQYKLRYVTYKDKLFHPCNSLIIIDPYLLIKREINEEGKVIYPGIANNLESLLDAILPSKLAIDFHLTIISCLDKPNEVKRVYEKIKKCLKRIRRELTVKLGLFYTEKGYYHKTESFHSRHVFSNTFAIDSEDGLDLFTNNGYLTKNNPTVSVVFPRLIGNCRQDMTKYENWIRSVKKFVEMASEESFCGTKDNRLFEIIEEK